MDLTDYLALPYRIEIHPEVVEGLTCCFSCKKTV